jgi:hypothetical protein
MIRKFVIQLAICAAALAGSAYAQHRDLDLHDYDDDLMRDLDKTIKYFEPDITAGNAQGAMEDAEILQDGFRYTEKYFTKKGDADDAVKISQQGEELIAAAIKSVGDNDFEAAAAAARDTAKTCRACHDVYKPLTKK